MKSNTLGELEQRIMDIIWERKNCSARDVLTILQKDRKLAYTTVATILQRLYKKGLVNKKEDRSGYLYSQKLSKESYSKKVAKNFIKKFVDSYGDTAISSFAETIDTLPEQKREYFLKLLGKNDKSK